MNGEINNYLLDWHYAIVNGNLKRIRSGLTFVTYHAESEDSQFIVEDQCAKRLLRKIKDNYPEIIFKIYKVMNFEKSDKFYYSINGLILNYALENFILVEIPKIGRTFTLINYEDLEQIKSMFKNEEIKISVFNNGIKGENNEKKEN